MVNRVEGLGLPRRRDSGVKACLQACVPGVSGSAEAPRQAAGYVTGSPVRPSGGHALWGEAAGLVAEQRLGSRGAWASSSHTSSGPGSLPSLQDSCAQGSPGQQWHEHGEELAHSESSSKLRLSGEISSSLK